jgi:DNA-binding response OmpR family regulator
MDLLARKVLRAGLPIELTAKEYSLLEYFMRNAGKVLTRTMIAEHVWDVHFDSDTNVIDVYVNYLRNKIDKPFDTKLLQTVRGGICPQGTRDRHRPRLESSNCRLTGL